MLIEGSDYFVRSIPFKNTKNTALVAVNDDGTYDIYLNSLCSDEKCREGLAHELSHLDSDHLYSDNDIRIIEAEANGENVSVPEIEDFPNKLFEFASLESFKKYIFALAVQKGVSM